MHAVLASTGITLGAMNGRDEVHGQVKLHRDNVSFFRLLLWTYLGHERHKHGCDEVHEQVKLPRGNMQDLCMRSQSMDVPLAWAP